MRYVRYILPLLLTVFVLAGCRSTSSFKKEKQEDSSQLITVLMDEPPVQEFTSSLSLSFNGTRLNGQLRMRRGHSIQISASMLGLVEVARIELLPDMVVVMDRVNNLYSVCHYADLPYRNELELDYDEIEALLWNRLFVPGLERKQDAARYISVIKTDENGVVTLREKNAGYMFETDGTDRLNAVLKKGDGYSFRIDYSDFSSADKQWIYPMGINVMVQTSDKDVKAGAKLSSLSVESRNWPDRTQVSRRMKQVTLDELLDNLGL